MSNVKYYDADQVNRVLTWPLVNEAVKAAFEAVTKNEKLDNDSLESFVNQPPRTMTRCGNKSNQLLLTMPAFVGNYEMSSNGTTAKHNTLACKLVTSFSDNASRNPPLSNVLAHILIFNSDTGHLESVVDGTQITAWRTASASIVATKYLYFERGGETDTTKPINVAIIGCGVQGNSHALGMCATYNVSDIYLWNRTPSKAESLAQTLRTQYPKVSVHVCTDAAAAVAEADVICVATYSPKALIDYGMISKGAVHINTIGAGQIHFGEVAQDIYDVATIYVDSWENAKAELKDLKANIVAEVGEIIKNGKRPANEGITLFQSMGMAAEDATVAQAIVDAINSTKSDS